LFKIRNSFKNIFEPYYAYIDFYKTPEVKLCKLYHGTAAFILLAVIAIVITLTMDTIFLMFGIKLAGGGSTSFGHTFITALLMAIVAPIPCLGFPNLQWYS